MEQACNLILIGGTGTDKTHLAIAIGIAAIHQSKRLRFYNAIILDELGFLPFPAFGGALIFHLISQLYEKTSLILTINKYVHLVENVFAKFKHFSVIAIRYDKLKRNFEGSIALASAFFGYLYETGTTTK